MTTIEWIVQCDYCDRMINVMTETFLPLEDGRDCCNTCESEGAL